MPDDAEDARSGPTVTFETKVWEGDYRIVLDPARIGETVGRNRFDFAARTIFVNNVDDVTAAVRMARVLVADGLVDDVVVVEEHASDALARFGLTRDDLGRGYVYSVSELVSLHLCRTDFLLHFSGDSVLAQPCDWLPSALELFARRSDLSVVNASWTADLAAAESESFDRDGDFLLGHGFSDQMYLVRTAEMARPIYGETHPDSERYPEYGGELFEKRVDAWMRNHGRLRGTWTGGHYVHENISPAPSFARRALGRLGRTLGP